MRLNVSIFWLILFTFLSTTTWSQFINMDQTINYLNDKFDGSCIVDTKKADLVLKFYENNEEIRMDLASFDELDQESVIYNYEEKSLIIKCLDRQACVFRKLHKEKIKRYYKRINIPFEGDSISNKGLEKAFKHLILLVKYDSYKSNEPFE
jgi:hypothetical protein